VDNFILFKTKNQPKAVKKYINPAEYIHQLLISRSADEPFFIKISPIDVATPKAMATAKTNNFDII
jgi:hypothetical protein